MTIRVEVIQALPRTCREVVLELPDGATVADAVGRALARKEFQGSGVDPAKIAVFGRIATAGTVLGDGDRIEFLRDLARDPKDQRRERARS